MSSPIIAWLQRNRTSRRLAFGLRIGAMGGGALLGLFFSRALVHTMGSALYGLFINFLDVTKLGGLSDVGMSGAISYRASQHLGRNEDSELRRLLASARSVFLFLGLLISVVFVIISPWLPHLLNWKPIDGAGPLQILFVWAGLNIAVMIVAGYFHSLNFAYGTVTWPILPPVILTQALAPVCHWFLARHGAVLWIQVLPYCFASILNAGLAWRMLKWSHPWLGNLKPLGFDRQIWKMLATTSGWVYLSTVGNAIYFYTDRLMIAAGFGSSEVPRYYFNYKIAELATILVLTASFVSIPKFAQLLASGQAADRERLIVEGRLLNTFQILFGSAAALCYLIINDAFVSHFYGPAYKADMWLQLVFACNLAVTTGGDAGIQLASRCGDNAVRNTGLAIGVTGFLNLALSYVSMRLHSITGIAVATVVAQTVLSLCLGYLTCRHIKISVIEWWRNSWFVPFAVVALGGSLRMSLPPDSPMHILVLFAAYAALLAGAAWLVGLNREMVLKELKLLAAIIRR